MNLEKERKCGPQVVNVLFLPYEDNDGQRVSVKKLQTC